LSQIAKKSQGIFQDKILEPAAVMQRLYFKGYEIHKRVENREFQSRKSNALKYRMQERGK